MRQRVEVDSSRQIAIIDSMLNRKLAGIALAPVDRKALVSVVDRASSSGIPVAIFDSDIDTKKRITYVATDNREGGRMAARFLGELLMGEGKVAIIGFMPGSASTMEREEGFEQELKAKFPKMEVVQLAFGMADRAKARAVTENILTAHPDLRGLFADNESSSVGAVMALKARANSRVRTVVFDANDQLIADLQDRQIDAMVVQYPFVMGYESVKAIGMKLRGEKPSGIDRFWCTSGHTFRPRAAGGGGVAAAGCSEVAVAGESPLSYGIMKKVSGHPSSAGRAADS